MQNTQFWAFILFLFLGQNSWAQNFDDYRCLRSSGDVPERFSLSSAQKYELGLAQLDEGLSNRDRKTQEKYQQKAIYTIDDLLRSGKVLFGTPLNDYVNRVGNRLLEHTPELKGKVDFFIIRSSAVNAFATATGLVCINMGLLAQLENEAQLAFVLSHELMHVQKQHGLSQYEKDIAILKENRQRSLFKKTDFNSALLESNSYSRELEFEADKGGLEIFLKTPYSVDALESSFQMLYYSYLLYDTTRFDVSYYNEGSCQLDPSLFLAKDSLKHISAWVDDAENTDTLKSTHPSTLRRWEIVKESIAGKTAGDKLFIEPQADFERMRKTARYELASYYLHNFRFEDALYVVQLLRKEEPNSRYLREVEVQALHAISRFSMYESRSFQSSDYRRQRETYKNIEGGQQQLYFLSSNLRAVELSALALYKAWKLHKDYPEDRYIFDYYRDAIYVLQQHIPNFEQLPKAMQEAEIKAYLAKAPAAQDYSVPKVTKDSLIEVLQDANIEVLFDSYRKEYGYSNLDKGYNLARYILSDLMQDEDFEDYYSRTEDYHEAQEERDSLYNVESERRKAAKEEVDRNLGIDSILYVNPYMLSLKRKRMYKKDDYSIDFKNNQKLLDKYYAEVHKNADKLGLSVQTLDTREVETLTAERYADVAILKDWIRLRMNIDDRNHPIFNQREVDEICEKYGSHYVVTGGYMQEGFDGKKRFRRRLIFYSALTVTFVSSVIITDSAPDPSFIKGLGIGLAAVSGVRLFFQPIIHLGKNTQGRGNQIYFSTIFNTQNSTYETLGTNTYSYNGKIGRLPKSIKKQIRKDIKRIKAEDK